MKILKRRREQRISREIYGFCRMLKEKTAKVYAHFGGSFNYTEK